MSPLRAARWIALALLALAAAPVYADGRGSPHLISARATPAGAIEIFAACPADSAALPAVSLDGGPPEPPALVERLYAPPALAIVVERGASMAAAGTPHSTSSADAIAQAELLLAGLPPGSQAAAVAYGARAELLAPLSGNQAGARSALAAGMADMPADTPAAGAFAEALGMALAQLQAAPPGPRAILILAADGPAAAEALPVIGADAASLTVVGLSAAGEGRLQAAASRLGAAYLPYHSQALAELPGLLADLSARYAEIAAPASLLHMITAQRPGEGRHRISLAGCAATAEAWVGAEAPAATGWRLPALALAGSLALGALLGRISARPGRRGASRRGAEGERQASPPASGIDAPTERGARRAGPPEPAYRLIARAGQARIVHSLRGRQCVIGRDPGCDLRIDEPQVAALHARVTLAGGRVALTDLASGGSTSLTPGGPGLPAHQPAELQDGDEFWLGPEVRVVLRRSDEE